ncbi:MAG TPA: dihydropteroate synthase [Candidatus Latescibacteria bacterium]|nr:dihydropteroate synthase [Candidatus Latescibacterota bacterium]
MIWRLHRHRQIDFDLRVQIIGVLNVTPDSFYDGGRYVDSQQAADHALQLTDEGADIIDIGGESSRPPIYGEVAPVAIDEECRRVVPVVKAIRRQSEIPISIDTVKPEVARQALAAGADIINDISAFEEASGGMADVAAQTQAPVILMHRRGTAATMQQDTQYDDLVGEVARYLQARVEVAREAGIDADRIAVDPGVGFGKSIDGNRELIRCAAQFSVSGCPVVIGASRKSFIWKPMGVDPDQALEGSLAAAVLAVAHGARALRVHDVAATVRAVRLAESIEIPALP